MAGHRVLPIPGVARLGVLPSHAHPSGGYTLPLGNGFGGQSGIQCSSRALVSLMPYLIHPTINFIGFEIQWKRDEGSRLHPKRRSASSDAKSILAQPHRQRAAPLLPGPGSGSPTGGFGRLLSAKGEILQC